VNHYALSILGAIAVEPKYLLPGAALLSLVSGPAGAALIGTFTESVSTKTPSPAGSTGLGPKGAIGGMVGGAVTFSAPFDGTLTMQVADLAQQGDVYQAFVNGHSLGFTAHVPLDIDGTNLSTGTFTTHVLAGPNTFDLNDQLLSYLGTSSPYGPPGEFVPASYTPGSVSVTLTEQPGTVTTPEPGVLAVAGSWLLAVGFLRRFRWPRRRA
jgi:hypothetical protein